MSNIDQFESIFRSAVKDVFTYEPKPIQRILVITDMEAEAATAFSNRIQDYLAVLNKIDNPSWQTLTGDQFLTIREMLTRIEDYKPDLICTYRNLHSKAWQYPHSLGTHLDVLLQDIDTPVLVMPHPDADYQAEHALNQTRTVMVVTDHLSDQHELVNYGTALTKKSGTLILSHIEDEQIFERYMNAISKIDTIETDNARERLLEQLLKEPTDYIQSCKQGLGQAGINVSVESLVAFGQSLNEYKQHIESKQLDLLVMNAKDDDQLAMHGMAYPLAVELRQIPLLII